MSLVVRLIGRENDYNIVQTIIEINQYLDEAGLPNYHLVPNLIPYDIPLPWIRWSWSDFNDLRYLAVKLIENLSLTGDCVIDYPEIRAELLNEQTEKNDSHLICHSPYYGYFVPVDFQNVALPDHFLNYIGSSINLRNELEDIADKLELDLGIYTPNFELLYQQRYEEFHNDSLGFEKFLILYLYNLVIASVKYNLIIEMS